MPNPHPTKRDFDHCSKTAGSAQRTEHPKAGGSNHYCRDAYDTYVKKGDGRIFSLSQQLKVCEFNGEAEPQLCAWKAIGEALASPTNAPHHNTKRDRFF